jgi:hypothetical protein
VSDIDIHLVLRFRQAKVTNYQCYEPYAYLECTRGLNWNNHAPQADELTNITSLQIYIRSWIQEIYQESDIYEKTPALRNLDFELDSWDCDCEDIDKDYCEFGQHILKKIFGIRHSSTRRPPKLKTLRLTSVCLELGSVLLPELFDLTELEHLQLIRCRDFEPLLRILEPSSLNLSSLCIGKAPDIPGFALKKFMGSLGPLKRVVLRSTGECFFGQRSLQQHIASVECLCIENEDSMGPPFEVLDGCLNLEQLALSGFEIEDGHRQIGSNVWPDGRRRKLEESFLLQVSVYLSETRKLSCILTMFKDILMP